MQPSETISATEHILALRDYPRKPAYFFAALEDVFANLGHIPDVSKALIQSYFMLPEWPDHLVEKLFHNTSATQSQTITVCEGPCCREAGSDQLVENLKRKFDIPIERRHCMGNCHQPPAASVNGETISVASPAKIRHLLHST